MRVAWNAKHLTLFGVSWVKAVWTLLFLAFAIAIPLAPLQRWFVDAVVLAPSPVGAVALAVVSKVGVYGLLRVSFGLLPDGSRWAATTLVAAGVLTIVVGGCSRSCRPTSRAWLPTRPWGRWASASSGWAG